MATPGAPVMVALLCASHHHMAEHNPYVATNRRMWQSLVRTMRKHMYHTSVEAGEIAEHGYQPQGLCNGLEFGHHGEAVEQSEKISIADERRIQLIRMFHAQSITKRYKMGKEIRAMLLSQSCETATTAKLSSAPAVAWLQSSGDCRHASRHAPYGESVGDPYASHTIFSGRVPAQAQAQATPAPPHPHPRPLTQNVTRTAAQAAQSHKPEGG
jgi:hypothetical protein